MDISSLLEMNLALLINQSINYGVIHNMRRDQIVLVDYFNTIPFQKALSSRSFKGFQILPAIPAECSRLFFDKNADIALVPVASWIANGARERIITDYCIGCNGPVATVMLQSMDDIKSIHTVFLDDHSRTSVELLKILCHDYWHISPEYIVKDVKDLVLKSGEAKLMIGDKVFMDNTVYNFSYDLGEFWKIYTGLPFAFAIWVAKDHISDEVAEMMNQAFKKSFEDMSEIIEYCKESHSNIDLETYFKTQISYEFDEGKRKALQLFKSKLESNLVY